MKKKPRHDKLVPARKMWVLLAFLISKETDGSGDQFDVFTFVLPIFILTYMSCIVESITEMISKGRLMKRAITCAGENIPSIFETIEHGQIKHVLTNSIDWLWFWFPTPFLYFPFISYSHSLLIQYQHH